MMKPTTETFDPTQSPTTNRPSNDGATMNDDTARLDAHAKTVGSAKYGRDVYPENTLFARFIRCPYGKATLTGSDQDAARAVPGVVGLSIEREDARYHGHAMGWVAADSPNALERGLRALDMQWSIEDPTGDLDRLSADDTSLPELGAEAAERLAADGVKVVDTLYSTPAQTHSSLETHGAVVVRSQDGAKCWISTQGVMAAGEGFARALNLTASRCEVIAEYVGGGFGSKITGTGKEGNLASRLTTDLQRPVWVFVDREEEHLDTGNRPSSATRVRVGISAKGELIGGQIRTWGGVGVSRGGGGVSIPTGHYNLGSMDAKRTSNHQFNAGGPRAFRAPGKPQAAFAEELMLDELAHAIQMDPMDLRRRHDTSDARKEMYDVGAKRIGWDARAATGSQTGVIRRGFGMGSTSWPAFPSGAGAEVVIHPDGSVVARSGTQDIGQGQRTAVGICAANTLGVPLSAVSVEVGSSKLPQGPASGGSVTITNTGPAVESAAKAALKEFFQVLAERKGGDAAEFEARDGSIFHNGDAIAWSDACSVLPNPVSGTGRNNPRERAGDGHSDGVQFADVSVDTETGIVRVNKIVAVQSCGRVVTPKRC